MLKDLPDGRYVVRLDRGVVQEAAPVAASAVVVPIASLPDIIADQALVGRELLQQIADVVMRRCG